MEPAQHYGPRLDVFDLRPWDPSLEEQVAFLRVLEAFIEQSENTLFEKAQSLQEWEMRLQQLEHDLKSTGD